MIENVSIIVEQIHGHFHKSAVQHELVGVLGVRCFRDGIKEYILQLFFSVEADVIIVLLRARKDRNIECGMRADGEIQRLVLGRIGHLPLHEDLVVLNAVSDLKFEFEGIFCQSRLVGAQHMCDGILCFADQREVHIAGETVLSHGIADSLVAVLSAADLAHKREQDGRVAVPVLGIRLPDHLVASLLVIDTAELCAVIGDCDFDPVIFYIMHHNTPPSKKWLI